MAFLLGSGSGSQVSEYEQLRRQPGVESMLACQAIFGEPVDKLFPGLYEKVEEKTKRRAQELSDKLKQSGDSEKTQRKLALLKEIMERGAQEPVTLPWEKKTLATA